MLTTSGSLMLSMVLIHTCVYIIPIFRRFGFGSGVMPLPPSPTHPPVKILFTYNIRGGIGFPRLYAFAGA